jgi:hypothetical protein
VIQLKTASASLFSFKTLDSSSLFGFLESPSFLPTTIVVAGEEDEEAAAETDCDPSPSFELMKSLYHKVSETSSVSFELLFLCLCSFKACFMYSSVWLSGIFSTFTSTCLNKICYILYSYHLNNQALGLRNG